MGSSKSKTIHINNESDILVEILVDINTLHAIIPPGETYTMMIKPDMYVRLGENKISIPNSGPDCHYTKDSTLGKYNVYVVDGSDLMSVRIITR